MKAVVVDRYGGPDALHLEEVPAPVPGDGRVRVRVRASSVNPYDWHLLTGLPKLFRPTFGMRRPKHRILGADLAGQVEAVGKEVAGFRPGDEVYGLAAAGAFAEYVAVPEGQIAPKPAGLTFEEAAALPLAGFTALQALRDQGKAGPGQRVLINGASGGVGSLAVQIAKALGAEVTGVCSTPNVELVRALGADHVVDYTREDFAAQPRRYHFMFDNVGNRRLAECRRVLEPRGVYLASFGQPEHAWLGPLGFLVRMAVVSPFVRQRLATFVSRPDPADLRTLTGMVEAGTLRPVVDRAYPLGEVAVAFRHLERWHARGKVVITV